MLFAELRLAEPILRALITEGYVTATPVQAAAIPPAMEGRDVLGSAQTGTGKTAAFALPILHRLIQGEPATVKVHRARCLVLAPTRELATQIATGFRAYGKHLGLRSAVIFGGVNQNGQVDLLRRGVDIIVATPGRLLDLMNQGHVDLSAIHYLVLDEADRMLDMGFIHDIKRIVAKVPPTRQTLLFSATMPTEIRRLADAMLRNPFTVTIAPVANTAELIEQSVYHVEKKDKPALLAHLVKEVPMYRTIVFTRTKHGADRVVRHLHSYGIAAEAIHGNKSQNARQRALDRFKQNKIPVLVATDIASRGIDVDDVSHVVNYDLTHEPETYVHRIGRTGRAGAKGSAVSFCDREELPNLRAIEKLLKKSIPVKKDHPAFAPAVEMPDREPRDERQSRRPSTAPTPHPAQRRDHGQGGRPQSAGTNRPGPGQSGQSGQPRSGQPRSGQNAPSQPRSYSSSPRPGQSGGRRGGPPKIGGGARPAKHPGRR